MTPPMLHHTRLKQSGTAMPKGRIEGHWNLEQVDLTHLVVKLLFSFKSYSGQFSAKYFGLFFCQKTFL